MKRLQRTLYLLLLLPLLCALLPAQASFAAGSVKEISTAKQLAAIADDPDADYVLKQDIDLTAWGLWTPIPSFSGTLDGAGHAITGMRVSLSGKAASRGGLFADLSGSVSNLRVTGASVTLTNPTAAAVATIIGVPNQWYPFMPGKNTPYITACEVGGSITLNSGASDANWHSAFALMCAEDSTANVAVNTNVCNNYSAMLYACETSVSRGSLTAACPGSTADGTVSGILRGRGCTNYAPVSATADVSESYLSVYGVQGEQDNYSLSCKNLAPLSSKTLLTALKYCRGSSHSGALTGDSITALISCINCDADVAMQNAGLRQSVSAATLQDDDYGGNIITGSYTYKPGATPAATLNVSSMMGESSEDSVDVTVLQPSIDLNVSVNIQSRDYTGFDVYHNGDILLGVKTGTLNASVDVVNTGNISCTTGGGNVFINGGKYNSGSIRGESADEVNVYGAHKLNTGAVTAISHKKSCTAIGVTGASSLNRGSVTAQTYGADTAYAFGSKDANLSANEGKISASAERGQAVAFGTSSSNSVNNGQVNADSLYAQSNAGGVGSSGSVNYGNVHAKSTAAGCAAFGFPEGVTNCASYGTVTADSLWMVGFDAEGASANAHGDQGIAIATGACRAYAFGVNATATSQLAGLTVTTGFVGKYLISHSPLCGCDQTTRIVPIGTNITDEWHGWVNACCATYEIGTGSGTGYTAPTVPMPQKPQRKLDGDLSLGLYSSLTSGTPTGEVTKLLYACGSYSFAKPGAGDDYANTDHSCLYMKLDGSNTGDEAGDFYFEVALPEGWSFAPDRLISSMYFTMSIAAQGDASTWVEVYPLYTASCPSQLTLSATGDMVSQRAIAVSADPDAGTAYFPASGGISKRSGSVATPFVIDPIADFAGNEHAYNDHLAKLGVTLAMSAYDKQNLLDSLQNAGFSRYTWYESTGANGVAHAFAQKTLVVGDEVRTVLMVAIRGTKGIEWRGDFIVDSLNNPTEHASFAISADEVLADLYAYCTAHAINTTKARVFVCGHSRGGAVANLVAQELDGNPLYGSVSAYTCATPNTAKNPVSSTNIYNIVYYQDLVGHVPDAFGKHGSTLVFGSGSTPQAVADAFSRYTNGFAFQTPNNDIFISASRLSSAIGGNLIATLANKVLGDAMNKPASEPDGISVAHCAETYLSWINNASVSDGLTLKASYEKHTAAATAYIMSAAAEMFHTAGMKIQEAVTAAVLMQYQPLFKLGAYLLVVDCPVDVQLLDESGAAIASFKAHTVESCDTDAAEAVGYGESDMLMLPYGKSYTLRVTGTDEGTMDTRIYNLDTAKERIGAHSYIGLPVTTDESMTLSLYTDAAAVPTQQVFRLPDGTPVLPGAGSRVMLPSDTKRLADNAFAGCASLEGLLYCPAGMEAIGANAFKDCAALTGVWLPDTVTTIADTAFAGCSPVIYCPKSATAVISYAQAHGLTVVEVQ